MDLLNQWKEKRYTSFLQIPTTKSKFGMNLKVSLPVILKMYIHFVSITEELALWNWTAALV